MFTLPSGWTPEQINARPSQSTTEAIGTAKNSARRKRSAQFATHSASFINLVRVRRDALTILHIRSRIMRGLNIRVSFALARIAEITDPESSDMIEVQWEAEALGHRDYWDGCEDVPTMFADEPYLRNAWMRGNADAETGEEMQNCSGCTAARGDPCPYHG
jgi:hypothetical protein